jgi:hypothetical protein
MSLVDHPISQPILDISPIWTPIIAPEVRKLQLRPVYIMCENCVIQRICLFNDNSYSDSTLISTTIAVKQCRDIGAGSHVCGMFLIIFMFILTLADG